MPQATAGSSPTSPPITAAAPEASSPTSPSPSSPSPALAAASAVRVAQLLVSLSQLSQTSPPQPSLPPPPQPSQIPLWLQHLTALPPIPPIPPPHAAALHTADLLTRDPALLARDPALLSSALLAQGPALLSSALLAQDPALQEWHAAATIYHRLPPTSVLRPLLLPTTYSLLFTKLHGTNHTTSHAVYLLTAWHNCNSNTPWQEGGSPTLSEDLPSGTQSEILFGDLTYVAVGVVFCFVAPAFVIFLSSSCTQWTVGLLRGAHTRFYRRVAPADQCWQAELGRPQGPRKSTVRRLDMPLGPVSPLDPIEVPHAPGAFEWL